MEHKHRKPTWFKAVAVAAAVAALAACSSLNTPPQQAQTDDPAVVNEALDEMAQLFAKAVTDEAVRLELHAAVAQRFDGDTEVLFETLAAQPVLQGQSAKPFKAVLAELHSGGSRAALAAIDALAARIPYFQVAVPVHFEQWDPHSFVPLVGFMPADFDEATTATITAYDAQGNVHLLDARIPPAEPVILLGLNERTDEAGNLLPEFRADYRATASPEELALLACKDVIVKTVLIRETKEAWGLGDPEVKLIARSKTGDLFYHGDFLSVNDVNVTYTYNRNIGCSSTDVGFFWYEDDANFGATFEVKWTMGGVEVKAGVTLYNSDEVFGSIVVANSKFDGVTSTWDLGSLKFTTN